MDADEVEPSLLARSRSSLSNLCSSFSAILCNRCVSRSSTSATLWLTDWPSDDWLVVESLLRLSAGVSGLGSPPGSSRVLLVLLVLEEMMARAPPSASGKGVLGLSKCPTPVESTARSSGIVGRGGIH